MLVENKHELLKNIGFNITAIRDTLKIRGVSATSSFSRVSRVYRDVFDAMPWLSFELKIDTEKSDYHIQRQIEEYVSLLSSISYDLEKGRTPYLSYTPHSNFFSTWYKEKKSEITIDDLEAYFKSEDQFTFHKLITGTVIALDGNDDMVDFTKITYDDYFDFAEAMCHDTDFKSVYKKATKILKFKDDYSAATIDHVVKLYNQLKMPTTNNKVFTG